MNRIKSAAFKKIDRQAAIQGFVQTDLIGQI
jgi:hypothetical protein